MSNSSSEILEFDDEFYICHFTRERNFENIDNLDSELIESTESAESSKSKNNRNKNQISKKKPEEIYKKSSEFVPFEHTYHLHNASSTLP
ncbi:12681_t:CDS:1, partial [Funneliformis geosporum]